MNIGFDTIVALTRVRTFDSFSNFPNVGTEGKIFIDSGSNVLYRWDGTQYVMLANGSTNFSFQGLYDASTNTPNAETTLTTNGNALIVSVAGEQTIDSIAYTGTNSLNVGDILVETTAGIRRIPFQEAITQNVTSGRIPRVVDGSLVNSAIRETTDALITDKTLEVPQGSAKFGEANTVSEYGGIISILSEVTDNRYLPVLYQEKAGTVDPISDTKPFYFTFNTAEDVEIQDIDTEALTNVSEFNITSLNYRHRLNSLDLNFTNALTNLRIRVTNNENGNVIKHVPSKAAWESGTGGISVSSGKQEVYPANQVNATPTILPPSTEFKIEMQADSNVNLQGDTSNNPYLEVNVARVNTIFLDSGGGGGSNDYVDSASFTGTQLTLGRTGSLVDLTATIPVATTTTNGALSSADKTTIDGLATVATSGSYDDLSDKPTIPTARTDEEITDLSLGILTEGTGHDGVKIQIVKSDTNDTATFNIVADTPSATANFYHGLSSSNNPATIVLTELTTKAVGTGTGQTFDFNIPSATEGDYVILLVPSDHDISALTNTDTGFSILDAYTKTEDVRIINSDEYHSYTLGALVGGFTANYRATLA